MTAEIKEVFLYAYILNSKYVAPDTREHLLGWRSRGHKRIIDYVEDTCRTFANIVDNFRAGEVYNVGGKPDWEMDIKSYSDLVRRAFSP